MVFEQRQEKEKTVQPSMESFVQKVTKFSNPTLNQMVGLWAIRTSQPWLRIEDKTLQACFQYANPHAHLFGRTWLANFAHRVYLGQRETVISELQVSQYLLPSSIYNFHVVYYVYLNLHLCI